MTTNNRQESPLDSLVRRIVREELRDIFSTIHSDGFLDEPKVLSLGQSNVALDDEAGQVRQRKRKGSAVKGRVTNPKTDKRLKVNREANA